LASETEEPLVECCQLRKQSSYAAAQEKNVCNWLRPLLATRKRVSVSAKNMKQIVLHIPQVIEDN
jgi:hypothetical protein